MNTYRTWTCLVATLCASSHHRANPFANFKMAEALPEDPVARAKAIALKFTAATTPGTEELLAQPQPQPAADPAASAPAPESGMT